MNQTKKSRVLLSLAFIFATPFCIAWYLFYHSDHTNLRQSNQGELIHLPFNVSALDLHNYQGKLISDNHKWTILYWTAQCNQICQATLDKLLRVRLTLGKDKLRTLAYLATDQKTSVNLASQIQDKNGLDTQLLILSKNDHARELLVKSDKPIVLIDPNGNVIMRYSAAVQPKAIQKDLKRLLKVSKIG